ncbi:MULTISPECIES: DUF1788 domain-containing protein [unclassified Streptomyces]|uniref:DUF1788 domain-containing protein n=1 Tax=unclassified Streptomyces TaxID=2593676 RepID=UPI00224E78D6|nr:DUF1788 domain-containing protein [Streptomyces sp. NBC_00291]MCX5153650.1 DUF1788 domain-containing protein [Streptomyces sp. NBC_00291]
MTDRTLPEQEKHLFDVLSSDRFLRMEGLANEVPFFIQWYPPDWARGMDDARKRVSNRLSAHGITVREINLYDLSIGLLKDRGVWEQVLAVEPDLGKDEFRELLQGMLDPQKHLAPAVSERIADGGFDILFLTGIGEVFPYIRSHNVLNNLQSVVVVKPMLMFFPGKYAQSETLGSSLVLFGLLQDDQYYRAKDIQEQEA